MLSFRMTVRFRGRSIFRQNTHMRHYYMTCTTQDRQTAFSIVHGKIVKHIVRSTILATTIPDSPTNSPSHEATDHPVSVWHGAVVHRVNSLKQMWLGYNAKCRKSQTTKQHSKQNHGPRNQRSMQSVLQAPELPRQLWHCKSDSTESTSLQQEKVT